jgi:dihydrofolate synthase/folylpolyglutamate synthase
MPPWTTSVVDAALDFLYGRIDYERAATMPYGSEALKLARMRQLLDRLGNPLQGLPIIHVAGTKGKGSTAAMIAAALTAAGMRTVLFSSPHLHAVEERLAIDGAAATPNELVQLIELVRPHVEALDRDAARESAGHGSTFFDITTAMALLHFRRRNVQAAVLEVGLGGRLDSTNVCQPVVSVITNISLDHTRQLGNTTAQIAREKAGIIKPGVPVISGVIEEEPRGVIREVAAACAAPLLELGRDFHFSYEPPRHLNREAHLGHINFRGACRRLPRSYSCLGIGSLGAHQAANAAIAVATLGELAAQGWNIPEAALRRALAQVSCPARVEIVSRWPTIVRDAAHNVASISALVDTLNTSFDPTRRILIFATTQDKDYRGMLQLLLPAFDEILLTRYTNNPRGVPVDELDHAARELGCLPRRCADPPSAFRLARELARPTDLICITGSFYLAAELELAGQAQLVPDATTERHIA